MRKVATLATAAMLGLAFAVSVPSAYAGSKVDCDAVMNELNSGKKAKEVAADLKISVSSVNRCKRHAKEAAKAETKTMPRAAASAVAPGAPGAPSAAASPAAGK
ncbi:MAG TPA: hypothetical protein VEC38_06400 [Candidatus Binataceae bacterium]|nr:hypothetical protein [Candidatus Binataceae bacterium]